MYQHVYILNVKCIKNLEVLTLQKIIAPCGLRSLWGRGLRWSWPRADQEDCQDWSLRKNCFNELIALKSPANLTFILQHAPEKHLMLNLNIQNIYFGQYIESKMIWEHHFSPNWWNTKLSISIVRYFHCFTRQQTAQMLFISIQEF